MTDFLLLRPPRRMPRVLAVAGNQHTLAAVVLDPWELRYAGETKSEAEGFLQNIMARERPHVIAVCGRSHTATVARQLAKRLRVPTVNVPCAKIRTRADDANPRNAVLLPASSLVSRALNTAHAAIDILLQRFYATSTLRPHARKTRRDARCCRTVPAD